MLALNTLDDFEEKVNEVTCSEEDESCESDNYKSTELDSYNSTSCCG
jgi:hypothetical protein